MAIFEGLRIFQIAPTIAPLMQLQELDYQYPVDLIATEPRRPTRVLLVSPGKDFQEINMAGLLEQFRRGDLLVVNESKVLPMRIFTNEGLEILFLKQKSEASKLWEVLFPSRDHHIGAEFSLPGGLTAKFHAKGLPQVLELSATLPNDYFLKHGEMAIPPYIQSQRDERHARKSDFNWYQSAWARVPGSVAAPTASLHFQSSDIDTLKTRGIQIAKVVLHVGAGTFFPIRTENLDEHQMHFEQVEVPGDTAEQIQKTKKQGGKVWVLGTTVARALESWALNRLEFDGQSYHGQTDLFIKPPYDFRVVDILMTNFHQPRSTLLALVSAFGGIEKVREAYAWAIERKFRLFSYGDLTVWTK